MRILIVGDSQAAGPPGQAAERRFRELGHDVERVGNPGKGPHDYSRMEALWEQYVGAVSRFAPDQVLLIFGSNDAANAHLEKALQRLRSSVRPPVWLSGPPHYADDEAQARGAAIHAMYERVFGTERFISAYGWTRGPVPRAPDGLHFTKAGGQAWGYPLADELLRRVGADHTA